MNKYQKMESKIFKEIKKIIDRSIASGGFIFNHIDYQRINSNEGRRNYLIDLRKDIKRASKICNMSIYEVMQSELEWLRR
ncbi:hypothetical protein [Metaclostridioides mangenotii]|uniref:hypothetical protein n=1 Tax=Metaclostridioides mangenotii TaxID=1540 RepID=UPI0026EE6FD5|nr:hypothetical protein [Clostridioides mangenotii]